MTQTSVNLAMPKRENSPDFGHKVTQTVTLRPTDAVNKRGLKRSASVEEPLGVSIDLSPVLMRKATHKW